MEYSVHNLTEVTDCDSLLTWAQNEKGSLNLKSLNETSLINKYSTTSIDIAATLEGVLAEISAADIVIAALPAGAARTDAENRKKRLEYQKFLLENRKANYGFVALLQKQSDLQRIQKEIEAVDSFIEAIKDRKNVLLAA